MIRRVAIGLGFLFFAVCCGAVFLLGRPTMGWQALSVPTGSMRPTVPPGSLVVVHRVPLSSLKAGDVITYTNPLKMQTTLTHRIIKSYKIDGKVPAFITKGDANPSPDPPVVGGLVQGKMLLHVPYVGRWLMWSKSWLAISLLVYVPAVLLMTEEVKRLSDYFKSLQPYRAWGYQPVETSAGLTMNGFAARATSIGIAVVMLGLFMWQPALALLKSNTVALVNNRITVAQPVANCANKTNVTVNNSSSQTATSGNSSGGSASSGNASNSNSTSTTVTVTNSC